MNHVVERPTSLLKPPLPNKAYSNVREHGRPGTASFNRKVRLFEGVTQVPEDAEKADGISPLRRRQPKAVTPEQKRWTHVDETENSSLWITQPKDTATAGGSCKQKTLKPVPSPRLLSPASPNRPSPRPFGTKEVNENGVKKTPKPKPRARSSVRSCGFVLDNDFSEVPEQISPSSHHLPSPVPDVRKTQDFSEQRSRTSPSFYKPPPTIPNHQNNKEANRRSHPVYYTPPPGINHKKEAEFVGITNHTVSHSYQPPLPVPYHKGAKKEQLNKTSSKQPPASVPYHKNYENNNDKLSQIVSAWPPQPGPNHKSDDIVNEELSRTPSTDSPPLVPYHKNDEHFDRELSQTSSRYRPPVPFHKKKSDSAIYTSSTDQPPVPYQNKKSDSAIYTSSTQQSPVPYHKKKSDSVIYVNNQNMDFNRFRRAEPKKPRALTQFENVTYDAFIPGKEIQPQRPCARTELDANGSPKHDDDGNDKRMSVLAQAQRPRARTELDANGSPKHDDDDNDKRMSVLALAQSFGSLTHSQKDLHIARPKTSGSPVRNGHSSKVTSSNPDLLSDNNEEHKELKSQQNKVKLGHIQRRISKSLSDFDLIEMPPMDPTMYTSGGKVKPYKLSAPSRPQAGPQRPVSMAPAPVKPTRTYEHDVYLMRKSLKGLPQTSAHTGVAQTKSAVPSVGRTALRPPSYAPKKRHVYDDVHMERHGEEEREVEQEQNKEYVTISPPTSSVRHGAPTWPNKSPYRESANIEPPVSPKSRPASTMSAITKSPKRGKLQRSARIERSHSTEDLHVTDDLKISGEYANPEIALMSKNKKEKGRKKTEYSEPYLQRSSSEDSLYQERRKTQPPVEDSAGYTVPGSHLWTKVPDQQEEEKRNSGFERNSGFKLALHNLSGEKLIMEEATINTTTTTTTTTTATTAAKPRSGKRFLSRRHRQKNIPRNNSTGHIECPPTPTFRASRKVSVPEVEGHFTGHFRQRSRNIHMRQKIQNAFSRQKDTMPEEDTLSQTSEDSDGDLNDSVLKKRLTHVRMVKRRTSAYCSLEWYRKTMQYSKLYEYVVVVSLKFNQETRRHEPCEIKRFPYEISDSQSDKLRAIPLFCFPDAFKWAKVEEYNSESYSFVLTSVDGSRLYGYNRRILPPGDGPRLPEVYCVMSPIGCAPVYNELLDEIEKRRQVSMSAVETLLRASRDNPFPRPGERLRIKMPTQPIAKPLIIHRPTDSRLEQMNFSCLFDSLDVGKVIQVFASLLLERRVVMCSSKLSKLSSCSQAIAALLYPFAWQHVYIPVLPEKLIDMCCSPTPYIMGMLSLCIPKLDEMPGIDEVIVVDLDSKDFYFLVGDEETILPKKLYQGLLRALSFVERSSSTESIDDMATGENPDAKNMMISEAFMHFFVETVGHYSNHFATQFDGQLKFDRDGFLNAVRSRSTRRFLEVFTETQMFSLFIQEKETESEGICQGMFERRVKAYEREKANNATFSTKMKKIVKDSGNRLAETAKDVKTKVKLNMSDKV